MVRKYTPIAHILLLLGIISLLSSYHLTQSLSWLEYFKSLMSGINSTEYSPSIELIVKPLESASSQSQKSSVRWCGVALLLLRGNVNGATFLDTAQKANSPFCLIKVAEEMESYGHIPHAKQLYEIAIALQFDIVEAHRERADIFYREGLYDKAVVYQERVIQLGVEANKNDFYRLSQSYRQTGQIAEAHTLIERS